MGSREGERGFHTQRSAGAAQEIERAAAESPLYIARQRGADAFDVLAAQGVLFTMFAAVASMGAFFVHQIRASCTQWRWKRWGTSP